MCISSALSVVNSQPLRISGGHLQGTLVQLDLRAHSLNLCSLLFQLRGENFHTFLLLGYGCFQFLDLAVFFEELVEQHRIHLVVAYAVDFAIATARHEIRAYLFYVLSDESETTWTRRLNLLLVAETHRLKAVDYFAGLSHRVDLILETP